MQEEVGEWKSVIPYVPNSYHGAPEGTKAHRKRGYRIWVVNTSHSRYSVDKETNSVVIDEVEVSARKISLTQLREKLLMKGTKVQTLGGRAVAGAWLVAWAMMAMGTIINTHMHAHR